jgi:2-polyprenyl-3-methyl-5-hydroxy-6-metoxy-1,4-benzoquinol methylase
MKDRHIVPELMDDPRLDEREHQRALAGLRRINRLCGRSRYIATYISSEFEPGQEIRILDLGCGSGDMALDLFARLQDRYRVKLAGWDMSPVAIKTANDNLRARHLRLECESDVVFEQRNALDSLASSQSATIPGEYDVVYCTLFMHHFTREQSIELLKAMKQLSKAIVIVDDLRRTRLGWWLAKVGCHLLSRSPVVHFDGPQSVRAAYRTDELLKIAEQAGLRNAKVTHHWPERFLCCWKVI